MYTCNVVCVSVYVSSSARFARTVYICTLYDCVL